MDYPHEPGSLFAHYQLSLALNLSKCLRHRVRLSYRNLPKYPVRFVVNLLIP